MRQALEVHRSGEMRDVTLQDHVRTLSLVAERKELNALREALRQRYQ